MARSAVQTELQLYLREINEVDLLTAEQEKELGWLIVNDSCPEAKETMIKANLRLVIAIGKNYVNAKNFLEKRYTEDMELEDAIHTALLTLREGFEGEMNCDNIEVGVVRNGRFTVLTPEQIQDYLDEAN